MPSGDGGRVEVAPSVLLAVIAVSVAAAALVAAQLTGARLPVLAAMLPDGGSSLVVVDDPAPLLDCAGGTSSGGLVPRSADGSSDLRRLAEDERSATAQAALLVSVTAHRSGDGVTVVWMDAVGRPRLVLGYVPGGDGYVLASRSACTS